MDCLENRLLGFDFLSLLSKVELWLCFRGEKPVAMLPLNDRFRKKEESKRVFRQWIDEAGLFTEFVEGDRIGVISRKSEAIKQILPILFSNTEEDTCMKCELFGYPKETVKAMYWAYAKDKEKYPQRSSVGKKNPIVPWWPYVRYIVRKDFEYEDSLVAKRWQEIIRRDIPELDTQFCKEMEEAEAA